MNRLQILVATAGLWCNLSLSSLAMPSEYSATYKARTWMGDSTVTICSDGKGRCRRDIKNEDGTTSVTIIDQSKGVVWTYDDSPAERAKRAFRSRAEDKTGFLLDDDLARKLGALGLGKKVVQKQLCHGWQVKQGRQQIESWVTEKGGIVIMSLAKSAGNIESMVLQRRSAKCPATIKFAPPSNYKIEDTEEAAVKKVFPNLIQ